MTDGVVRDSAFWDEVAARRWGRYISAVEMSAIDAAQATAPAPRQALDVGCGSGRWTRFLLDRGWSVTGVDVDADSLAVNAERNPEANLLLAAPEDAQLPAADRSTSLIVCIEVLAVTHSDWFMTEARRVLVPGGRLVAVVWNRRSGRGAAANALSKLRNGSLHTHYRTSYRSWRAQLQEAGFRVEAEHGVCWFPFGRVSDSPLVPAAVALERGLHLDRLPSLSPWVVVSATLEAAPGPDGSPAPA